MTLISTFSSSFGSSGGSGAGTQGIQGIQGSQALQGIFGIDGILGVQGVQGIQGLQSLGLQGAQGVQGFLGANGASYMYQVPLASGQIAFNGWLGTTTNASINVTTLTLYPTILNNTLTCSSISLNITTALASGLARILVYSNDDTTALPNTLLFESANIDVSTTGVKTTSANLTFLAGVTYWIGVYGSPSGSIGYTSQVATGTLGMGFGSTTSVTMVSSVIRSATTFGSAPNPFSGGVRSSNSAVRFGFTIA